MSKLAASSVSKDHGKINLRSDTETYLCKTAFSSSILKKYCFEFCKVIRQSGCTLWALTSTPANAQTSLVLLQLE